MSQLVLKLVYLQIPAKLFVRSRNKEIRSNGGGVWRQLEGLGRDYYFPPYGSTFRTVATGLTVLSYLSIQIVWHKASMAAANKRKIMNELYIIDNGVQSPNVMFRKCSAICNFRYLPVTDHT